MRAVIPVAGLGTRMHPLSRVVPKELLPLGRWPVLHHVVRELASAGVTEFQMVTSERTSAIERYFEPDQELDAALRYTGRNAGRAGGDDRLRHCSFSFVRQVKPRGVSDAVLLTQQFVTGGPFFLHMGDSLLMGDPDLLDRMIAAHDRFGAVCTTAVQSMAPGQISTHGTVIPSGEVTDSVFEIHEIVEKPRLDEIVVPLGLIGRHLISAPMLPSARSAEPHSSPLGGLGSIFPEKDGLEGPVVAVCCRPGAILYDAGTLEHYLLAQVAYALRDDLSGPKILDWLRRTQHL